MLIRRVSLSYLVASMTILLLLTGLSRVCVGSEPKRISIAYCKDSVPFHFSDESGQPAGMIIDLWRLWSEKTGIAIDFHAAEWNETLTMVGSGAVDAHAGLFYNQERDKFLDYGAALTKTDTHYFFNSALPPIKRLDDLAAYRVGVIGGDYVENYLKERLPQGAVLAFSDYEAIMKALGRGVLKVFAADTPTGLFYLERYGLLSEFTFVSEKPLYQNDFFFAVQEGNQALIQVIDQGMTLITEDEKRDIIRHWVAFGDKEGEALIVSIDRAYAPFTFVNALGRPSGLFVDMWRAWAQKAGRRIKFRASSWAETLEGLRAGEVDIHSGLSFSPKRAEWIDFSTQIYETYTRIYHRAGDDQPKAVDDYGTNVVGTQFDTYQEAEFRKAYPDVGIRSYGSNQELIEALLKDEIKAFVQEEQIMEAAYDRLGLRGDITARSERLFPSTIHAGILKGNSELLEEINNGFAALDQEQLADIEKRWVPNPEDHFFRPKTASLDLSPEEASWLAEHPILRVAPDPDFVPIEFFNEQGQYQGLAADFLNLAAERLGVRLEAVQKENWTQAMEALRSGEADLIGANVPVDEFKKEFLFTEPYIAFYDVIITHDEIKGHIHLEDLAGKEVLVVKGWPEVYILRDQYPDIKVIEVESTLEALLKIVDKEYEYFLAYFPTSSFLIQEHGLAGTRVAGILDEFIPAAVMVRKDSEMLRNLMDKALASITEYERRSINQRWIPGLSKLESGMTKPLNLDKDERVWLTEHPVIRVAMDPDWAPVEFSDSQGRFHGISMDYLHQLSGLLGTRFETVEGLNWQEAMTALEKGELDLLPSMARTPEREALFNFTDPYLSMPINIFAGGEVNYIGSLEALEGRQVVVVKGYAIHEWLQNKYPGINLLPVASVPAALKMLANGQAYAFVGNVVTTSYYISKLRLYQIKVVGETPFKNAQSMAVRQDWPVLAGILQKALEAIPQNQRDAIFNRWVSIKYEHAFDYSLLWKITIPVFLVLLFLFYWNRRLGREINERKRAERQLLESEKKTLAMSEAVHDGLIMIDGQAKVMYWNNAAEELFGIPADEAMGKDMHALFAPEEYREQARAGLEVFAKTGQGPVVGKLQELTASGSDGARFPVEVGVSAFQVGNEWYAVGTVRDITKRKKAEEDLKESEQRVRTILDSINTGIVIIDPENHTIVDANPIAVEMIGTTREKIIGSRCHKFICPREENDCPITEHNQSVDNAERVLLTAEGNEIPVLKTVVPVTLGGKKYLLESFVDITERRRMELETARLLEVTRLRNKELATINHVVKELTGLMDFGKIIDLASETLNQACEPHTLYIALYDKQADQITFPYYRIGERQVQQASRPLGKGLTSTILQEKKPLILNTLQEQADQGAIMVTGECETFLGVPIMAGAESIGVLSIQHPEPNKYTDDDVRLISTITANLGIALEKARLYAETQEAEERSRMLLESAGEGIFGMDSKGRLTFINPAAIRMLGFQEEELFGQNVHQLIHHSHADGSFYPIEDCPMFASCQRGVSNQVADEVLWRKDGRSFYVEYSSTPMHKDGRVIGAVITFRDVTERKKVEKELKQNLSELERFSRLVVGREERMIQLKAEINDLLEQAGQGKKYKIVE